MSHTQYTKHVPAILWIRPVHAPSPFFKHCTQQWNCTLSHAHLTYYPVHDNPEMVMSLVLSLFSTPILSTVLIYRGKPQKITLEKKKTFITYDCSVTLHVGTFQPKPTHLPLVLVGWHQELNWRRFVWDLHPTSFTFDCLHKNRGSQFGSLIEEAEKCSKDLSPNFGKFYQYIQSLPLRGVFPHQNTIHESWQTNQSPLLKCNWSRLDIFPNFQACWKSIFEITWILTKEVPPKKIISRGSSLSRSAQKIGGFIDTWQGRVSNACYVWPLTVAKKRYTCYVYVGMKVCRCVGRYVRKCTHKIEKTRWRFVAQSKCFFFKDDDSKLLKPRSLYYE